MTGFLRKSPIQAAILRQSLALVLLAAGCGGSAETEPALEPLTPPRTTVADAPIQQFCTRCHDFPDPAAFPREAWKAEVAQAYRFHEASPGYDGEGGPVPPIEQTLAWFVSQAPEALPPIGGEPLDPGAPLFERTDLLAEGPARGAAIASLQLLPEPLGLWACDMQTGSLFAAGPGRSFAEAVRPVEITNPCRVVAADLDGDGGRELLVSDLGSFLPQDHNRGGVWKLSGDSFRHVEPVLTGVSRVCDVQPADFDGDGDIDLAVAEFGWRRSGRLLVVWNEGGGAHWRTTALDERHGTIDVPVVDLNGDGRPDIVALISQEFEAVCAYLNEGNGGFARVTLYEAGEPSFGSSGIQVVDFDGDGDLDVLHTNGDSFDTGYVRTNHGVRWLENRGEFPFVVHELAHLAGAHRAIAGDLDLDGDLDVAAVSLLSPRPLNTRPGVPSIVWLEREGEQFHRRVVELDQNDHSCCTLIDWDGDGDLDLLASHFHWGQDRGPVATLYRNLAVP